jgi:hypothetical protein
MSTPAKTLAFRRGSGFDPAQPPVSHGSTQLLQVQRRDSGLLDEALE